MKKHTLALSALSILYIGNAVSSEEIIAKSDLKAVTVFLHGASLTNKGTFNLTAGNKEIVFPNLPPNIDQNSIQAKGEGEYTILAVSYRTNYLNTQPKSKEIIAVEDSMLKVQTKYDAQKNLRWVYETESSLLTSNKNMGGANTGVNFADLEKMANFYRTRLSELVLKIQESTILETKLTEDLGRMRAQLAELNAQRNKSTGEVVVSVFAKSAGNAKMTISYTVMNASWSPIYDIRANNTDKNVKMDFRATIIQNTGMNWNDVDLTLSTGNPSENGTQPAMNPWWVSIYAPSVQKTREAQAPVSGRSESYKSLESVVVEDANVDDAKQADYAWQYTEVEEGQTNVSYEISIPYTIPSDNKPHSVSVQNYTIPATFRYFAIPKLDQDAFLLARLTDWDKYNLLPGNINIFFEENFVGKSYLNTKTTSDTLDISLGRDKNVTIKRNLLKDLCEKKIIGTNKKETRMYEILVRNKKKQDIDLEILDQVPLARNGEIEVETQNLSGGDLNKETGTVSWKMTLKPGEDKKLKFGYSVKFPRDKVLSGL